MTSSCDPASPADKTPLGLSVGKAGERLHVPRREAQVFPSHSLRLRGRLQFSSRCGFTLRMLRCVTVRREGAKVSCGHRRRKCSSGTGRPRCGCTRTAPMDAHAQRTGSPGRAGRRAAPPADRAGSQAARPGRGSLMRVDGACWAVLPSPTFRKRPLTTRDVTETRDGAAATSPPAGGGGGVGDELRPCPCPARFSLRAAPGGVALLCGDGLLGGAGAPVRLLPGEPGGSVL